MISARRTGRLQGRKGNRNEWLVLVPTGLEAGPEPGPDRAETELTTELREEVAELWHALGRAEGRAETLLGQVSSLAEALSAERARGDRLEAALAEARRPWLLRLVEGLRRKSGY